MGLQDARAIQLEMRRHIHTSNLGLFNLNVAYLDTNSAFENYRAEKKSLYVVVRSGQVRFISENELLHYDFHFIIGLAGEMRIAATTPVFYNPFSPKPGGASTRAVAVGARTGVDLFCFMAEGHAFSRASCCILYLL